MGTVMSRDTRARRSIARLIAVLATVLVTACLALAPPALAQGPADGGRLTAYMPVSGAVTSPDGIAYTFTAVAGQHVTLAISSPLVQPSGDALQMQVYDSSNASDAPGTYISTTPTDINFTPTAAEAGSTTVVISPYNSGATGSFTLTYAPDMVVPLTSGVAVTKTLQYEGQNADFTFDAVAGQHLTVAITAPLVQPSGESLQMQVYDHSGANDAGGVFITTSPTEIDFTPTDAQAGPTTVVISPYNQDATGTFTITYAIDAPGPGPGSLTSGTPVNGALLYGGQHADYTFTAVADTPVSLQITNPDVSPQGDALQMQVYDRSGANDANGTFVASGPTEIDFTPTPAEAGPTTVVISPYNFEATGSFTLTYIAAETTSTSVECSPQSLPAGSATSCTATVLDTGEAQVAGAPTGDAQFDSTPSSGSFGDGSDCRLQPQPGPQMVSSCSLPFTPTSAGSYAVSASYGGDNVHFASNGGSGAIAVNEGTSTTVSCMAYSLLVNSATSCMATVSDEYGDDSSTPTGTVSFTSSPASALFGNSGTCSLSGSDGVASCSVSFTPSSAGDYDITGTYSGAAAYGGSSGSAETVAVTAQPTPTPTTTTTTGSVAVVPQTLVVSATGTLTITITCAGTGCTGTIELTVVKIVTVRIQRRKVTRTEHIVIGSATFSKAQTGSSGIKIRLNATGKHLLKTSRGKLNATATISFGSGARAKKVRTGVTLRRGHAIA